MPSHWKTWTANDYRVAVDSLEAGRPFITPEGEPTVRYAPFFPILLHGEALLADGIGWSRRTVASILGALTVAGSATLVVLLVRRFVATELAWLAGLSVVLCANLRRLHSSGATARAATWTGLLVVGTTLYFWGMTTIATTLVR